MSRILIAGCGYVGGALAEALANEGDEVWGLRRSPGLLPKRVRGIVADLTEPGALQDLPDNLDCVFYTVGAEGHTEGDYRNAYLVGLRHFLGALCRQPKPPRRIIFTSSTAVYGQTDGRWVDEDSPAVATHFSGAVLLEAEELLRNSDIESVVLRLGGIYGPGRTRLIETVRDGTASISEGPPQYLNLNHRDDCVGALQHLMTLEDPMPVYLGVDGSPVDRTEILRWVADELGVEHPPVGAQPKPSRRQGANKRCRNDRLVSSGYGFKHRSYREGHRWLIADLAGQQN